MTLLSLYEVKLPSMPNIKMLLLKAALKQSSYNAQKPSEVTLPKDKFYLDKVVLDKPLLKPYHQVVGWELGSGNVHPCYLHSLAFPLHIKLLLLSEFPFPLLGLIHVSNQIIQVRPIRKGEVLSITSCFDQLKLHPKGWVFSIKVTFYSGSELVWQSLSTNLFRTNHGLAVEPTSEDEIDDFPNSHNTAWELNANLGRRYAKVSGDFNPIHLAKWSAKLFGFKQHIIHGMWTKSYCISALQKVNPSFFSQAFEINTKFKQPLFLPNKVNFSVQSFEPNNINNGLQFKVLGFGNNKEQLPLYLKGSVCAI